MIKKLVVLVFFIALLASCIGESKEYVKEGLVRDTLFSVEPSKGGVFGIFMTHDDFVVYCTPDPELGARAKELLINHDGEVLIEFRMLKWKFLGGDDNEIWKGCQDYYTGDGSSFVEVMLVSIKPVAMRTGQYRG